jgi:CRISPR-associated protein Csy1
MQAADEQNVDRLRTLIQQFLEQRLNDKLSELPGDTLKERERHAALRAQYDPISWLASAARRAAQIRVVTHTLKPIHPDAKGTSLYCLPSTFPARPHIGSHCLGHDFDADVVGNAAALDVYKLLRLAYGSRTLLDLAVAADPDLIAALHSDPEIAKGWVEAFAGLAQPSAEVASHTHAKQLYWLHGEDAHDDLSFHLLAPLYPSSLVHRIYRQLQRDRFSDDAKAARAARRERVFHVEPVREYPDLALQKLGGTKPQNISQLNSERRGANHLFASLPPNWKSREVRPLLSPGALFTRFGRRPVVRRHIRELGSFLLDDPPSNEPTRLRVATHVEALLDELVQLTAEQRDLPPGWSRDAACELPTPHRQWLDPEGWGMATEGRQDEDALRARIAADFGRWLNGALRRGAELNVGTEEFTHWSAVALRHLESFEREVA